MVKRADTLRADGCDCRTFLNLNNQHIAVALQAHITEKARSIQRMNGRIAFSVCEFIAYLKRQVREHRTGLRTGDTFNADIFNDKIRGCRKSDTCNRHERRRH